MLEDLNKGQPDAVFCLGDLVDFAPWPNEVIETIRQRRIPTLMGNHDERIAFDIRTFAGGKFAVNTGSVGRSKEKRISAAAYLMLTIAESRIRPEIVRVVYPVEETIKAILESTIPDFCADFLLEMVSPGQHGNGW